MADDILTLAVNGKSYAGWTSIKLTHSLEVAASTFEISVSEKWAGRDEAWQIQPFDKAVLAIDGETVLTGYVERYQPGYETSGGSASHTVSISGRSKTCDVIDCMPEVKGGHFVNYTIDKIARALCGPFGVNVVMKGPAGAAFPDATLEKCETAYGLLEKLSRVRGLLVCDDADGNLVFTQAGTQSAAGALVEGENIKSASAELASNERFQKYVVLSQAPLSYDGQDAHLDVIGTATDSSCPRFRRFAEMAETPSDAKIAAERAKWRALRNYGRGTRATITVQGWRQSNGKLWQINQLIPVKSPMLALNRALLIGGVSRMLDEEGRRTELTLMPPEAYEPAPDFKHKKGKGTGDIWAGLK